MQDAVDGCQSDRRAPFRDERHGFRDQQVKHNTTGAREQAGVEEYAAPTGICNDLCNDEAAHHTADGDTGK